jgi:hypothetical protein
MPCASYRSAHDARAGNAAHGKAQVLHQAVANFAGSVHTLFGAANWMLEPPEEEQRHVP